ncbi:MAG: hypothetical protein IKO41_05525, partial [Lachnospiraceae bacterium]|nr:hypothetical protein [Lachnospiraceae bacterium]
FRYSFSEISEIRLPKSLLSGIFRVALLFTYQGALLSQFFATAYLQYHSLIHLSTTFLTFFQQVFRD